MSYLTRIISTSSIFKHFDIHRMGCTYTLTWGGGNICVTFMEMLQNGNLQYRQRVLYIDLIYNYPCTGLINGDYNGKERFIYIYTTV